MKSDVRSQILLLCVCQVRGFRGWNCTMHDAGTFLHSNDSVLTSSSTAWEICSAFIPFEKGKGKKKNKQKSKCIVVYWEINYLKEMRFQGTDEMNVAMMLQPYCFSIAFFRLWSPCDTSSPSLPLCGNTELRVNDWVNCGVPIGTLVVVGMTGVVHCRRRWEVRCMKEWEAREL